MTLTYSSIFTFLNAYCSPFPVFLKPAVSGELGARSLPSLLAALIRDRAPMVQRTLVNLLRLLGTEHRWCKDPIVSMLFIIIIIIIIIIFEKSVNFAHASELVEIYVLYGFQK